MVKEIPGDEEISDEDIFPEDEVIVDEVSSEEIDFDNKDSGDNEGPTIIEGGEIDDGPKGKVYVAA